MTECIVMTGGGGGVDCDEATAKKGDVLRGKKFGGADSDELQIGELPDLSGETDTQFNGAPVLKCNEVSRGKTNKANDALLLKYDDKKGCVSPGTHFTADWVDINSALNIAAGLILAGKKVGNVDGTATNDATATAGDLLINKTAYAGGKKIQGTMPNRGTVSKTLPAGQAYTIPAGYHNGSGKVTAANLAGQTQGNAVAGDIIKQKTAWVSGGRVTGTLEDRAKQTGAVSVNASSSAGYVRIPVGAYRAKTNANYPEIILNQSQLDYIARQRFGGVAFNGATFDGLVLSGVAQGKLGGRDLLGSGRFGCEWHGRDENNYSTGVVAYTPSINLSAFRQIDVTVHIKSWGTSSAHGFYYWIHAEAVLIGGTQGNRTDNTIKQGSHYVYHNSKPFNQEYDTVITIDVSGNDQPVFLAVRFEQSGGTTSENDKVHFMDAYVKKIELKY